MELSDYLTNLKGFFAVNFAGWIMIMFSFLPMSFAASSQCVTPNYCGFIMGLAILVWVFGVILFIGELGFKLAHAVYKKLFDKPKK
ncbi:MAG: hypothetical protein ABH821_03645 [archaeon]